MSKASKNREKNEFSGSKLYELLIGFTKEEFKRFGLFIKSPYFNKSKTMGNLYVFFKQNFDKLESPKITKEKIASVIYPGERYDEANVRKQLSNFTKLAEEFLMQTVLEGKKYDRENLLTEGYYARQKTKYAEQQIIELRKKYKSESFRDSDYYHDMYTTERLFFALKSSGMKNPEEQINKTSFILDLYYISVKLLHHYTILNLRLHYNKQVNFDSWAFDDIVRFIEKHKTELEENHKSLYADYLSVKMLLSPDSAEPFEALAEFISKNKNVFVSTEKDRMLIYLYNHSIYRYNKGYVKSPGEVFAVIREMESENVPLWHFFAFHMYYVNAVKYSCMQGEYDWAVEFMKHRRDKIQPEISGETYSLAMANYYFNRQDYSGALRYLVNVDFPNYSFYIGAKIMQIKIYWELSEPEGVLSTIDAVRKFLQRKELIPQRLMESTTNFINCVSKMVDPDSRDKTFEIKKILEKEISTSEKLWVEEKLKSLSN